MSGVYEGGLKVWECSLDLVKFIKELPTLVKDKVVLEIGCGQGLPGVMALKCGASSVIFQDFNAEVLEKATAQVVLKNFVGQEEAVKPRVKMLPGSWEELLTDESVRGIVDVVIMSETLYNEVYY